MTRPTEQLIKDAIEMAGSLRAAAKLLQEQGYQTSKDSIRRAAAKWSIEPRKAKDDDQDFIVHMAEELLEDVNVVEVLERRMAEYKQKHQKHLAHKLIPVSVRLDGPIGVGFMGDPHVDDDGADLMTLFRHVDIFNDKANRGLFLGVLGDMWNNWQGRLAHLWKEQSVNAAEARALVKAFLTRLNALFVVFGNHDAWSGHNDPLSLMLQGRTAIKKNWSVKLGLKFPNGRTLKIYAAHDFAGSSQWSQVFGASKKAQLDGTHNIYVCGDSHTSGYTHGWHDGNEIMWHAVQVASYKMMDRYADELGLPSHHIYNCPVALIDPYAENQMNFIRWEWDPEEAAERLRWMRQRWEDGRSNG